MKGLQRLSEQLARGGLFDVRCERRVVRHQQASRRPAEALVGAHGHDVRTVAQRVVPHTARDQPALMRRVEQHEGADLIGLSGLITPSLEEMQYVAAQMQRDDHFRLKKIPLLIGGATTSRVHTAVKISPHYEGPVVYVPDASRSVGVAQNLLSDQANQYIAELKADYEQVRQLHANKKAVPLITLEQARENAATGRPVAIAGSISSFRADGTPAEQLEASYREQAELLLGNRVLLVEVLVTLEVGGGLRGVGVEHRPRRASEPAAMAQHLPQLFGRVRRERRQHQDQRFDRLTRHGLIVRPLFGDRVALCPPLIITEDQIGEMYRRFGRALEETAGMAQAKGLVAA